MSRSISITLTDDDDALGIVVESSGWDQREVVETILRCAEAMVQTDVRENLDQNPQFDGLEHDVRASLVVLNARLAVLELLMSLEPVGGSGVRIDLE